MSMSFENLVKYLVSELIKQPLIIILFILGIVYIILEIKKKTQKTQKTFTRRRTCKRKKKQL